MIETLVASSALIVGSFLLRPLLRGRVSPVAMYGLWGLAALRLVVPWFYPLNDVVKQMRSRLSIMNAVDTFHRQVIKDSLVGPLTDNLANGVVRRYDGTADLAVRAAGIDWQPWIMAVWVAGGLALAAWMMFVNLRLMRKLRAGRVLYSGPLPEFVKKPVYVADGVFSPFYFGLGRDVGIYLPERIADDERKVLHALAHESCHAAHGDRLWGTLRCVLLCYYWVDPLMWLGAVWSKQDCELACDDAAVRLLGEEERYAYGRTLVDLIAGGGGKGGLLLTSTTMAPGKRMVRDRLRMLTRHPRTTVLAAVVLAIGVAALGACTFTREAAPQGEAGAPAQADPGTGAPARAETEKPGPEPVNAYSLTGEFQEIRGVGGTSVLLKSVEEYPDGLCLLLEGRTEEDAARFYKENFIQVKLAGEADPDGLGNSREPRQSYQDGKEIHLLYMFYGEVLPLSQVEALVAMGKDGGAVENYFNEYLIAKTARQFVEAYLSGDRETAAKYSDLNDKDDLKLDVEEERPSEGTLTSKWDPMDKETYAEARYEFYEKGQDSYTYLTLSLKKVMEEWIVVDLWFEK